MTSTFKCSGGGEESQQLQKLPTREKMCSHGPKIFIILLQACDESL